MTLPRNLYQKIWDSHTVALITREDWLLYIDRHLVNEVTSPQAFEGLRVAGRKVRRPRHFQHSPSDGRSVRGRQ